MQIRKKGDGIKKKSSPLKLLSQSQPNLVGHLNFFFIVMAAILDTGRR
jgi:hypothetical protein